MKNFALLIAIVITTSISFSQSQFGLELVGGKLFSDPSSYMLGRFTDGFSLGGGLSYVITRNVESNVRLVYSELPYSGSAPIIVGVARDATSAAVFFKGEKASLFEVSGGMKLKSETSIFLRPYLLIKGGLYFLRKEIQTVETSPFDETVETTSLINTSSTNGFGAIGGGVEFSILSGISFDVEMALHKLFGR